MRKLRSDDEKRCAELWLDSLEPTVGEVVALDDANRTQRRIAQLERERDEARIEAKQAQDKIDNHRDLSGAKYLTRRLEEQEKQLAAFRDALPDPDKLDLLAKMFDVALPNDPNPEIQNALRAWAAKIRALAATEPVGLRARAAAEGVTLATPPDSQREIDLRTGKCMGPEPVEGGEE